MNGVEFADISKRLSHELHLVETRLGRVEHGLEEVLKRADLQLDKGHLSQLQEFDHLIQIVCCLADFITELGAAAQKNGPLELDEIIQSVPLQDLANRLRGSAQDTAMTKEITLF